jgi:hypothetical protein
VLGTFHRRAVYQLERHLTTKTVRAPPQSATYSVSTYTFQTNFGCGGSAGERSPTATLLTSGLTLPDGRAYTIAYEPTPGFPNSVTGRIASISLPSGGQISYTYTGGDHNTGVYCDQVSDIITQGLTPTIPTLTRTITNANGHQSVWVYNFSDSTAPAHTTTTVKDPENNYTVYQFSDGYQTEQQVYQGTVSPANLLKTVITCYSGNFTNCAEPATVPNSGGGRVSQTDVYTAYNGGPSSLVETIYNPAGMPSEVKQYDYGAAMPPSGAPLVDTVTPEWELRRNLVSCAGTIVESAR